MIRLKYTGRRTYTGYGIFASAMSPFVEVSDEESANGLLATGRFIAAEGGVSKTDDPPVPDDTPGEHWSVKQLRAYATENGIDLSGLSSKADILAKIQEAESAIDFSAEV